LDVTGEGRRGATSTPEKALNRLALREQERVRELLENKKFHVNFQLN